MNNREKITAIMSKLETAFPETAEASLMLAVIQNAIEDAFLPVQSSKGYRTWNDKVSAVTFLSGVMPHAEICGVESEWIRKVIYAVAHFKHDKSGTTAKKDRNALSRHLAKTMG